MDEILATAFELCRTDFQRYLILGSAEIPVSGFPDSMQDSLNERHYDTMELIMLLEQYEIPYHINLFTTKDMVYGQIFIE